MDIRTQRTRKMLFDAYDELLAEMPFEKISVSEICNTMNCSLKCRSRRYRLVRFASDRR